jgi:hypothetical protein
VRQQPGQQAHAEEDADGDPEQGARQGSVKNAGIGVKAS